MPDSEVPTMKQQFIESQIWSLSIAAAFQRGNIYKKSSTLTDTKKAEFKRKLKKIIDDHFREKNTIKSEAFIGLLQEIKSQINDMIGKSGYFPCVNKFRFGTLQKLVNLYLKYQWCLGRWSEPPHCPFDGVILAKLNIPDKWTQSDSADDYRAWVEKAKKEAASSEASIAQWELKAWNEWLESSNVQK